jgi:hypothetical protein
VALDVVEEDFYTTLMGSATTVRLYQPRFSGTLTAIDLQGYITDIIFVSGLLHG